MKVSELIERLQKMPQDAVVVSYSADTEDASLCMRVQYSDGTDLPSVKGDWPTWRGGDKIDPCVIVG